MKIFPVLFLTLLLTGCSTPVVKPLPPMLHQTPVGSVVQLNQPLTIPAQRVDAGIQFGKPVQSIEQYEPHCRFEVNTLNDRDVTLPAGDYRVTKIIRFSDPFYSGTDNVQVASADNMTAWFAMGIGGSADSFWYYKTVFYLESSVFPDIRQLTCGSVYPSGYEARDITLKEFENAVGDVVKLRTP
jgi:hypothetical protein